MNYLTNPDSPFFKFINKILYSVWLNILWVICCIPIITIGPATTALFYCCQKIVNDEEGYITKSFFHSFKTNLKQGITIGVIMTLLGLAIGFDGYRLYHLHNTSYIWTIFLAILIVAAIAYFLIASWIFPLLAHYENTVLNMFKNSIILSVRFIVCSALMLCVYFIMLVVIVRFFTPAIIFGMGTCSLINSMLLKNIFIQCERNEDEK